MASNATIATITPVGGAGFITVNGCIAATTGTTPNELTTRGFVESQLGVVYVSGMTLTLNAKIESPDASAKITCMVATAGTASNTGNALRDFATDVASGVLVPLYSGILVADGAYTIGATGNFSTIQKCVDFFSLFKARNDKTATCTLQTGFIMAEQVTVINVDLGFVVLSSIDPTVTIQRSALTVDQTTTIYGSASYNAFYGQGHGCVMPIINAVFSMDTSGTATNRNGILAIEGARAKINAAKGFNNSGGNNIYAYHSSTIDCQSATATGAGNNGIVATSASTINCQSATATGVTAAFAVSSGSTMNAFGTTGTTNTPVNIMNTVKGFIAR